MRRVTIRDVATECGVSVATVTKALRRYPDVAAETRQRILKATERLGYRPNRLAQSLVTRRPTLVGVYLDDEGLSLADQHFFLPVIMGIRDEAAQAGLDLLLIAPETNGDNFLEHALDLAAGGVIVMGLRQEEMLDRTGSSNTPVVTVDILPRGKNMCMVTTNNRAMASAATYHLLEQGCRRILFLGGKPNTMVNTERELGYRDTLGAAGFGDHDLRIAYGLFRSEEARSAVAQVLARERIDGIFAASDLMAIGALAAVREAGFQVPQDIAIVGFDDLPAARTVVPSLSTVQQDPRRMGGVALRVLQSMMNGEMPSEQRIVIPAKLVVRASSQHGKEVEAPQADEVAAK